MGPNRSSRQSRRPRSSQSSSRCRATRLPPGLVASLARPGGNLTGLSSQASDLGAKRVEILREAVPGLRRLAIMGNAGNPANVLDMARVHEAARILGLDAAIFEIRRTEDIAPMFDAITGRTDALYVPADALINTNRIRINALARKPGTERRRFFELNVRADRRQQSRSAYGYQQVKTQPQCN